MAGGARSFRYARRGWAGTDLSSLPDRSYSVEGRRLGHCFPPRMAPGSALCACSWMLPTAPRSWRSRRHWRTSPTARKRILPLLNSTGSRAQRRHANSVRSGRSKPFALRSGALISRRKRSSQPAVFCANTNFMYLGNWIRPRGEAASVELVLRLTAIELLLRPIGALVRQAVDPAAGGIGAHFPARAASAGNLAGSRPAGGRPADRRLAASDNHIFLLGYWCLAAGLALRATDVRPPLALSARLLIGFAFLFAFLWKAVLSPDYLDGRFFRVTLMMDDRFAGAVMLMTGLSEEQILQNRKYLQPLPEGAELLYPPPFVEPRTFRWLAGAATYGILALEAAIAMFYLLLWRGSMDTARHGLLLVFCLITYAFAPVAGFGWLLLVLGLAQCRPEQRLLRFVYVISFFPDSAVFRDPLGRPSGARSHRRPISSLGEKIDRRTCSADPGAGFGPQTSLQSLLQRLASLAPLVFLLGDELVRDVVLKDVAHISNGFGSDTLCGNQFDVIEPQVGIRSAARRFLAELRHPSRPRIVGGKGEQSFVERVHRFLGEMLVDHEPYVFHAGMDIRFELRDVAYFQLFPGRRHHLHHARAPTWLLAPYPGAASW